VCGEKWRFFVERAVVESGALVNPLGQPFLLDVTQATSETLYPA